MGMWTWRHQQSWDVALVARAQWLGWPQMGQVALSRGFILMNDKVNRVVFETKWLNGALSGHSETEAERSRSEVA